MKVARTFGGRAAARPAHAIPVQRWTTRALLLTALALSAWSWVSGSSHAPRQRAPAPSAPQRPPAERPFEAVDSELMS